tara:strand:- start:6 stop:962 length:957 start_codon:yes stop_codon:yes gene_type:complete
MIDSFLLNLSSVLGHTLLLDSKGQEPWGSAWALNGGDPPAPNATESTDAQMAALIKNLPGLTKVTGENILPFEQAKQDAANKISPQQNALALQLLQQFGPAINKVGTDIQGQTQLAGVQNDAAAIEAAGKSGLITNALALQRQADPEYYANRELIAKQQAENVRKMGTGELTPTELEQITRGMNRSNVGSGNANLGSSTAAISNAMNFGQAGTQKINSISNALSNTANSLQQFRSGFDPYQASTGKSAFNNMGAQQFAGPSQGLGQGTLGLSQGLLGEAGQNQRTAMGINANRRDSLDRFSSTFGTIMNGVGAIIPGK